MTAHRGEFLAHILLAPFEVVEPEQPVLVVVEAADNIGTADLAEWILGDAAHWMTCNEIGMGRPVSNS